MKDLLMAAMSAYVSAILQKISYELGDLFEKYEGEEAVFFLATCQTFVNSVLPIMNDRDKKVFQFIIEHSETAVMPRAFDPRRKGGGDDGKA